MARPIKPIDIRQVEELARIGCTEDDMAAVLGVSVDTIQRRKRSSEEFCGAIKRGQATTRNSLRRLQLKKALEGNVTMLIWLGKQLLGQSDAQTLSHEGPQGGPIQYIEVHRLPKRVRPDEAGASATEASPSADGLEAVEEANGLRVERLPERVRE